MRARAAARTSDGLSDGELGGLDDWEGVLEEAGVGVEALESGFCGNCRLVKRSRQTRIIGTRGATENSSGYTKEKREPKGSLFTCGSARLEVQS